MDRDALEALDKAALIELIVQLQARIAVLEAELARLRQPPKTPENSSIPPAAAFKPNRAERRRAKRGARRGHLAGSRLRQRPDLVVRCRPTACRGCGAGLSERDQRR